MENKEKVIQSYMKTLNISRQEALQLWEDDHSEEVLPEVQEMEEKVKKQKRHYVTDKRSRKKVTREIKEDPEKLGLMEYLNHIITTCNTYNIENVKVVNAQREISFSVGQNSYSLTLVKHRPPKEN